MTSLERSTRRNKGFESGHLLGLLVFRGGVLGFLASLLEVARIMNLLRHPRQILARLKLEPQLILIYLRWNSQLFISSAWFRNLWLSIAENIT